VVFGPEKAPEVHDRGHWEDVNSDGLVDLLLHFSCSEAGIGPSDTMVWLSGLLSSGERVVGSDRISVVSK